MTRPDSISIDPDEIVQEILIEKYGQRVIENNWRGEYVERMIHKAIGEDFIHTGKNWSGWDLEHTSGLRIEVKQSATLQSWSAGKPSVGRFDIAERKRRYVDDKWIEQPGRCASLYILAWHGVRDVELADHKKPSQWAFYVVPADRLPNQKSISQSVVEKAWPSIRIGELRSAVLRWNAESISS